MFFKIPARCNIKLAMSQVFYKKFCTNKIFFIPCGCAFFVNTELFHLLSSWHLDSFVMSWLFTNHSKILVVLVWWWHFKMKWTASNIVFSLQMYQKFAVLWKTKDKNESNKAFNDTLFNPPTLSSFYVSQLSVQSTLF